MPLPEQEALQYLVAAVPYQELSHAFDYQKAGRALDSDNSDNLAHSLLGRTPSSFAGWNSARPERAVVAAAASKQSLALSAIYTEVSLVLLVLAAVVVVFEVLQKAVVGLPWRRSVLAAPGRVRLLYTPCSHTRLLLPVYFVRPCIAPRAYHSRAV